VVTPRATNGPRPTHVALIRQHKDRRTHNPKRGNSPYLVFVCAHLKTGAGDRGIDAIGAGKVGWMGISPKVGVGGWVECSRVSKVRGDRRPCMCSHRMEGTRQTCEPRPQVGAGMEG